MATKKKAPAEPVRVNVANVELNPANPRLSPRDDGSAWNQPAMFEHFAADKGVRELAKDIVDMGTLNPSKRFIVQATAGKRYVALEGNRRVAALRLLREPKLAGSPSGEKFFRDLKATAETVPEYIDCVVMTFEEATHWLELEHARGQGGKATVSWETAEHSRFTELVTGKARHGRALALLDTMQKRGHIDLASAKKVPITTLDRIVTDKDVRAALGWTEAVPPMSLVDGPLRRVVLDLVGKMPVSAVMGKKERAKYIGKVIAKPDKPNFGNETGKSTGAKTASKATSRSTRLDWQRKYLIPSSFVCKSRNARTKEVVKELKTIPVEGAENVLAMAMRLLLEISLVEYAGKHGLTLKPSRSGGIELKPAFSDVAQHVVSRNIVGNDELRDVRRAMGDPYHYLAVETFHTYVHAKFTFPNKKDLNRNWTAFEPFFEALIGTRS